MFFLSMHPQVLKAFLFKETGKEIMSTCVLRQTFEIDKLLRYVSAQRLLQQPGF